jgi:hypothetical protein
VILKCCVTLHIAVIEPFCQIDEYDLKKSDTFVTLGNPQQQPFLKRHADKEAHSLITCQSQKVSYNRLSRPHTVTYQELITKTVRDAGFLCWPKSPHRSGFA